MKNEGKNNDFEKAKSVLKLPIYSTGESMDIVVTENIAQFKSKFQEIAFIDTEKFGKCLVIDGVTQTAETDHEIYDEEMLKRMKESDKNVLILGGGDGYIAQMAIEKNPSISVEVIDLDEEVVKGCEKYLGQNVFKDERVKLRIEDALAYMQNGKTEYDGVACDLTDAPVGAKEKEEYEQFFEKVISLASGRIREGGWISVQAGASEVTEQYINAVVVVENILKKHFKNVERRDVFIPSYGESCAFLTAEK